jgi:hypothetical protein
MRHANIGRELVVGNRAHHRHVDGVTLAARRLLAIQHQRRNMQLGPVGIDNRKELFRHHL